MRLCFFAACASLLSAAVAKAGIVFNVSVCEGVCVCVSNQQVVLETCSVDHRVSGCECYDCSLCVHYV